MPRSRKQSCQRKAARLCHDDDVRSEFTDGIHWVQIGKERRDVTSSVIDLIKKLDPDGKRPGFQDLVTASQHLGELIDDLRILLAIDDVWFAAQLQPFLRGGPNCVQLVTTRRPQVLPASHIPIAIDEMRPAEALSLMSANLPEAEPAARTRLATLADRLGNWAQMLAISNGWIRKRIKLGEKLTAAIDRFEERLKKRGLAGFDAKDEKERNRAILYLHRGKPLIPAARTVDSNVNWPDAEPCDLSSPAAEGDDDDRGDHMAGVDGVRFARGGEADR